MRMDALLQAISKVLCDIDDILITGQNEEDHLQTLFYYTPLNHTDIGVGNSQLSCLDV